ncbi:formate dehydrogenase accessory sulfurtransferase FdhD [Variovorax sp. dw_308]|uniref:formate dehydrogenase accessory sulfurtransferase FdhD n=1 Tax=Variovorax sp. dw_308 TaxID=2721546 RepID=UPI001C4391DA|nr:formate dehydrogenase accessory sulfurtransferase FdhD [Variovorax sp. dw_308]
MYLDLAATCIDQARGSAQVTVWPHGRREVQGCTDSVVEEVPVALVFNGISHAVMLATPADLDDFALGFGISEGLLLDAGELYGVEAVASHGGIELRLEVSSACEFRLRGRRRTMMGRTGCGLCGSESLQHLYRQTPKPLGLLRLAPEAVGRSLESLRSQQDIQQLTGASHAAAWCDATGMAHLVREDVGRHNALDKLIGALLSAGTPVADGFIAITSRASFEMVQKALVAGVDALVAVSAPTSLAVSHALEGGLGLAGFARSDRFVCYSFPERFGVNQSVAPSEQFCEERAVGA